ncbi:M20 family metallopeptidase [Listeria fleischmannii]|uniref:M20 family metallopeptidase n=1 Tax=Listeria fleischmannii TaxID=1069827 RepID=UPI0016235168|nr:M20 family metallopeptidase [Listeria fleischmannii]MBC1419814.1 M20 family metallopeptidase [Listeria fleischmannii]
MEEQLVNFLEENEAKFVAISHAIHTRPEIGNEEFFASHLLAETLEEEGFELIRGVAGHETAFIAKKSSGKKGPRIVFLAEYDALPGLGHACGHNIIGSTSIFAAISLGRHIKELGGDVLVYGTPAEEGGPNGSAKGSFVRAGLFQDIDAALMIHPNGKTHVTVPANAVDVLDFEFTGKAAHAATNPEEGINALDGVIQFYNGINALRQHLSKDTSIHGIITDGGKAANIVPDFAKARFFIRAAKRKDLNSLTERIIQVAEGAALQTGTKMKAIRIQNGVDNVWVNEPFNHLFTEVAARLNIPCATEGKGVGSSDAGNVSQVVPTIHPFIKIGPETLVAHTDAFREAAKSSEGDKALLLGAKLLALTALELYKNSELLQKIKEDQFRLQELEEK